MARSRVIPNLLYGTLGLAVTAGAVYFAIRALRNRREGEEPMLALRRSTREAGRNVKDTGRKVGRDIKRGVKDTAEAFSEAAPAFESDTLTRV